MKKEKINYTKNDLKKKKSSSPKINKDKKKDNSPIYVPNKRKVVLKRPKNSVKVAKKEN